MGTKTIRLDDETEQILQQIIRSTGLSISGALKKGLFLLHREKSTSIPIGLRMTCIENWTLDQVAMQLLLRHRHARVSQKPYRKNTNNESWSIPAPSSHYVIPRTPNMISVKKS